MVSLLETDVIAVNLDPGAERVHYDAEFDVRDLISLTEVMTEYDLGPNGAQILAADLLASQAGDVAEQLHALTGEMMIVDTPDRSNCLRSVRQATTLSKSLVVISQQLFTCLTQCYLDHHLGLFHRCSFRQLSSSD